MNLNLTIGLSLIVLGLIIQPIQLFISKYVRLSREQRDNIKSNKTLPFLRVAYIILGVVIMASNYLYLLIDITDAFSAVVPIFILVIGSLIINLKSRKLK